MGKTIQTIALFVCDRQKPNLIVAWVFLPRHSLPSLDTRFQTYGCCHAMEK